MTTAESPARAGRQLRDRYGPADLAVFTPDEARRFIPAGGGDPRSDPALAWELLYRLEPALYDQLVSAEQIHPAVLGRLPRRADRIVEVGAGAGRLTLQLIGRGAQIVAIEPSAPMRALLRRKLSRSAPGSRVRVADGFLDCLPAPSGSADLVVACSVLTPAAGHGGEAGLAEMERVCRPGGQVAIIWPNNIGWLTGHGYRYLSFAGPMAAEFASCQEAVELARIFYPHAAAEIRRRRRRVVPYELLGINPPRDLAVKVTSS